MAALAISVVILLLESAPATTSPLAFTVTSLWVRTLTLATASISTPMKSLVGI